MVECAASSGESLAARSIELPIGSPRLSPADVHRLMRQQGLDLAFAQAWVLDEVAQSIQLDPAEQAALVRAFHAEQGLADDTAAAAWRQQRGFSAADVTVRACQARRVELFRQQCFSDEVEIRFLERKPDLDQVVYSMVRVQEEAIAEEIYQRIREGEADFPELAAAFSLGSERDTRGQVGPMPLSIAHEELVRRLRVSRPGQLWAPFFVVDIWVVFRFEQLLPASLDDDVRQQMLGELFDDWFDERVRQVLAAEPLPPLPHERLGLA